MDRRKHIVRYFVSYSHHDRELATDLLQRLRHYLDTAKDYEFQAWQDTNNIILGEHWHEQIQRAIFDCDFGLLLISPAFLSSQYIREHELSQFIVPEGTNLLTGKRVAPVALKKLLFEGTMDLHGLEHRQIFFDKDGKTYADRQTSVRRDDFAGELFAKITKMLKVVPAPQSQSESGPMQSQRATIAPDDVKGGDGSMPKVGTLLVGRETELKWIDSAWENQKVGVIGLIAFGGVGKSTLAWKWWLRLRDRLPNTRCEHWSFYKQGATSGSQGDAEIFFSTAFNQWFKVGRPTSFWEQGKLIAECVRKTSMLLILDGLEPLQYPSDPQFGCFQDERMVALLHGLAAPEGVGLCICTSRFPITDLKNFINHGYTQKHLEDLKPSYGGKVLRALGVKGFKQELQDASKAYGGHALSLNLLGKYLVAYLDGDVLKRDTIPPLATVPHAEEGGHARRILHHYESVFPPESIEYVLLRCLGLFDRPMSPEALNALRREPIIEGLTGSLSDASYEKYRDAIERLKRLGLVEYEQPSGALDCHPIIRMHFAELLKANATVWREGNRRLFQFYAGLPTQVCPATREDMEALYPAVIHACRAAEYAEAWHIYWDRIQQGHPRFFNTNVLGAFHAGLGSLASFYDPPWVQLARGVEASLKPEDYGKLLEEVGFHLKVMGRFTEAMRVIRSAMETYDRASDYEHAAVNSENVAEAYLLKGDLNESLVAVGFGHSGVPYAELSGKPFRRMQTFALRGQILLCMGRYQEADLVLAEAEGIRRDHCADRQPVRSLYILDLLAELGRYDELFLTADRFRPLLDEVKARPFTGAFYFFLGQGYAFRAMRDHDASASSKALQLLQDARRLIDASMLPHLQPRAPCVRARLLVEEKKYDQAKADLDWALTIAEHARLKLFEVDCHLGFCQLNLALGRPQAARAHLAKARPQIVGRGYNRPRSWMEQMNAQLAQRTKSGP
jgi:tetratricopeptide (TPR) repeat protein